MSEPPILEYAPAPPPQLPVPWWLWVSAAIFLLLVGSVLMSLVSIALAKGCLSMGAFALIPLGLLAGEWIFLQRRSMRAGGFVILALGLAMAGYGIAGAAGVVDVLENMKERPLAYTVRVLASMLVGFGVTVFLFVTHAKFILQIDEWHKETA